MSKRRVKTRSYKAIKRGGYKLLEWEADLKVLAELLLGDPSGEMAAYKLDSLIEDRGYSQVMADRLFRDAERRAYKW